MVDGEDEEEEEEEGAVGAVTEIGMGTGVEDVCEEVEVEGIGETMGAVDSVRCSEDTATLVVDETSANTEEDDDDDAGCDDCSVISIFDPAEGTSASRLLLLSLF